MPNAFVKQPPKVSIIVFAYNEEAFLAKTIESLERIRYPREQLEFILADSRSTDRTREIAQGHFDTIVVTEGEHRSPARGESTGLDAATGKYACIFGGDTEIDSDAITKIVQAFHDDGRPNLACITGRIIEKGKDQERSFIKSVYSIFYKSCRIGDIPYATGGVYDMDLVRQHSLRFAEGALMEDEVSMGIAIAANGLIVKRIDIPFLYHESGYANSWNDLQVQLRRHLRVAESRVWLWKSYEGDRRRRLLLWKHARQSVLMGAGVLVVLKIGFALLAANAFFGVLYGIAGFGVTLFLGMRVARKYDLPYWHAVGYVYYKFLLTFLVMMLAQVYYFLKAIFFPQTSYPNPQQW